MPAKRKQARRTAAGKLSRKPAPPRRAAQRTAPKRTAPKPAPKRAGAPKRGTAGRATPKRAAPRAPKRAAARGTTQKTSRRATTSRERLRSRGRAPSGQIFPTPFEAARPDEPEPQPAPPPTPREQAPAEPRAAAPERRTESRPDEKFRPIVRGETAMPADTSAAPVPAWGEPALAPEPARGGETYTEDIPIAIVSLVLAASAFLPWYGGETGFDASVSAWESGTWGPITFFLGLGSFLLVVLRRVGVRLSLPFEEALLHEFAGWVALAGGVIKSRYRPGPEGLLGISWGLWVGLTAAFALAFLAGRMAPHAPLVRRPRWYREKGGAIAAVILLAVVVGAAVFGTVNKTGPLASTIDPADLPGLVRGRLPDCADGFPVPSVMRPVQGIEQPCQAHLQSDRPVAEAVAAMRLTLQEAGWTVSVGETGGTTTLNITAPKCATAAVVGAEQGSVAIVAFGICATGSPTPG